MPRIIILFSCFLLCTPAFANSFCVNLLDRLILDTYISTSNSTEYHLNQRHFCDLLEKNSSNDSKIELLLIEYGISLGGSFDQQKAIAKSHCENTVVESLNEAEKRIYAKWLNPRIGDAIITCAATSNANEPVFVDEFSTLGAHGERLIATIVFNYDTKIESAIHDGLDCTWGSLHDSSKPNDKNALIDEVKVGANPVSVTVTCKRTSSDGNIFDGAILYIGTDKKSIAPVQLPEVKPQIIEVHSEWRWVLGEGRNQLFEIGTGCETRLNIRKTICNESRRGQMFWESAAQVAEIYAKNNPNEVGQGYKFSVDGDLLVMQGGYNCTSTAVAQYHATPFLCTRIFEYTTVDADAQKPIK